MQTEKERLARLERENCIFKGLAVIVAVIVLAETITGAPPKPAADETVHDEVRARKFVLVDEKNNALGGWAREGNEVHFAFSAVMSSGGITMKADEAGANLVVMAGDKRGVLSYATETECGVHIVKGDDSQISLVASDMGQISLKGLERTEGPALTIEVKNAGEKEPAKTGPPSTLKGAGRGKDGIIQIKDEGGKMLWSAP